MRKIIHIDMDAFYASVEQRDNPDLQGKPVIVSGPPNSRSVVCTASYEARKFGVHSAMPASRAFQLCPKGIFVYPRFSAYKEVSKQIQKIFYDYTDLVEPLSLDEAYLDVTTNKLGIDKAMKIAKEIKARIQKTTDLTATAGVASGKFLAKVASGMNKPNGITLILPEEAIGFLEKLPIGKFYGIGKVTEKKLQGLGIENGKDLKEKSLPELMNILGKSGKYYYNIVRGIDHSIVHPERERKSIGVEETFTRDTKEILELQSILMEIIKDLEHRMQRAEARGKTITLKLKYENFHSITRSLTLPVYVHSYQDILKHALSLLNMIELNRKVRLLGVSISSLEKESDEKIESLF
ncbi:MAG: DNA polymerase IV [Leptospiraceae bacterium]|nr:DNA polymerase IV [Leptospiraceae bacterium]